MKLQRASKRVTALTLTELLVVCVILSMLVLLVGPALRRPRGMSKRLNCVNNLKQVGLGFRLWAGDNGDRFPMLVSTTNRGTMELVSTGFVFPHFQVMSNELSTPKLLRCPADSERTNAMNFTEGFNDWKVSYFVGIDSDETRPNELLSGDRNLTLDGVTVRRGLLTLTNSAAGWAQTIHTNFGNICFADGGVQQLSSARLRTLLERSSVTNRLAIP